MKFASVKPAKLSDTIVEQVEGLILKGILKPGEKLPPERELAQQLAVSRPSLREALMQLEVKGLIHSRRGGGTYVKDVVAPVLTDPLTDLVNEHPEAVMDILELRHALEEMAAFYAAQRATEADMERIKTRFNALQTATDEADLMRESEADAEFHITIAEASHNIALIHVMRSLFTVLRDSIARNLEKLYIEQNNYAVVHDQHRAIYEAIVAHKPNLARQAANQHLIYISQNMRTLNWDNARAADSKLRLESAKA